MATTMERPGASPVHPAPRRPGPWPVEFYRSAVGKKWVMALTGHHAHGLRLRPHGRQPEGVLRRRRTSTTTASSCASCSCRSSPAPSLLWLMRARADRRLRPAHPLRLRPHPDEPPGQRPGYQQSRDWQAANFASRSMRWTGIIFGLFLVFHLADLTWGTVNPDFVRGDVYHNFVATLQPSAGRGHLHRRQPRPRPPPLPRRLVDVPEPRAQQPAVQRVAPQLRRSASPRSSPAGT